MNLRLHFIILDKIKIQTKKNSMKMWNLRKDDFYKNVTITRIFFPFFPFSFNMWKKRRGFYLDLKKEYTFYIEDFNKKEP